MNTGSKHISQKKLANKIQQWEFPPWHNRISSILGALGISSMPSLAQWVDPMLPQLQLGSGLWVIRDLGSPYAAGQQKKKDKKPTMYKKNYTPKAQCMKELIV